MEFAGFTPKQKYALLKGMDYTGSAQSDEMDAFLASSPSAASMMGEYTKIAQQRIIGKPLSGIGMAEGGFVANEFYDVENNVLSQGNNLGSFETDGVSSSLIKMLGQGGVPYYQTIGGSSGSEVTNTFKDIKSAMEYVGQEPPQEIAGGDNPDLLLPPDVNIDDPENLKAATVSGGYDPDAVPANDTFMEGAGTTANAQTGMVGLNTTTNVDSGIATEDGSRHK